MISIIIYLYKQIREIINYNFLHLFIFKMPIFLKALSVMIYYIIKCLNLLLNYFRCNHILLIYILHYL